METEKPLSPIEAFYEAVVTALKALPVVDEEDVEPFMGRMCEEGRDREYETHLRLSGYKGEIGPNGLVMLTIAQSQRLDKLRYEAPPKKLLGLVRLSECYRELGLNARELQRVFIRAAEECRTSVREVAPHLVPFVTGREQQGRSLH